MGAKPADILHPDGHDVAISNPGKILFPADGITKKDVIEYYLRVSGWMVPHISGRPLALQRYPDGIDQPGFFQKAAPPYYPSWIRKVTVPKAGGTVRHVVCDNAATLVYLANQACLTPHIWLSQADRLRMPDRMIFDLDPASDNFAAAIEAAQALHEILDDLALPAFVKATGSRGLHVVVPLAPQEDFDAVRAVARQIAGILVKQAPARYTMEQYKEKRRGRLFVDTNRNAYAQTAVAPYALRARDGAPAAVPLAWAEIGRKNFRPDSVTLRTIFSRLENSSDPWKDFDRKSASLQHARGKLDRMAGSHAA